MNRQIYEMALLITEGARPAVEDAESLYNAGYRQASDVAREIFAEIEEIRLRQIRKNEFFRNGSTEEMERKFYEGAEWGLRQLSHWIAELKKKYESEKEYV